MTRISHKWLGCLAILFVSTASANAQGMFVPGMPPGAPRPMTPAISPYINLLRPGAMPAINYYGLVRPQVQAQQAITNLTREVQAVEATQQSMLMFPGADQAGSVTTGHAAGFFTHTRYYGGGGMGGMNRGGGGMGGAGMGGGMNRGMGGMGGMRR